MNVGAPADKDVGEAFTVSGDNNGPYEPANIDVSLTLSQVGGSDCVFVPAGAQTAQNVAAGLFNIAKSWSVTCSAPSTHQFRCDASLVVDEVHVEDRDHLLCPGASPCPDGWFTDCPGKPKDNCPDHYNPDQTDTDGNGKGDVCDGTPDHDVTVKSLLSFGPAPANLGDATERRM